MGYSLGPRAYSGTSGAAEDPGIPWNPGQPHPRISTPPEIRKPPPRGLGGGGFWEGLAGGFGGVFEGFCGRFGEFTNPRLGFPGKPLGPTNCPL